MNPNWLSFKQLDEAAEVPKGESFRAFRRLEQQFGYWIKLDEGDEEPEKLRREQG